MDSSKNIFEVNLDSSENILEVNLDSSENILEVNLDSSKNILEVNLDSSENILEVKNLSHVYKGSVRGIKDISFALKPGEFVIVAGQNGSGKSTLFRHLNGLMRPQSGEVLIHGKAVIKDISYARQKVGMIFQDADCQIVGETVYDDVAFGPENLNLPRHEIEKRVEDILTRLNMWHLKDQTPATLSGGEKRRLAIAGILAMNPEVIVMDEPFSNLDYPGTLDLLSLIQSLHESGQTLLIATHDIEKVIYYATRMIIIHEGRLAADDKPDKLLKTVEKFGIREPCASKLGSSKAILPWHS
ncbi:Energy-coupling factor transporter ATP-binding protein EcfA [Desulfamplus magnetovallimortis]|uniref:Energy-coupling factor transporter ATP-binding protein EcfA n=1 Tax=Desulfamplus magnetovallimortis TaxID=1246637 RepID=A0A1W1H723_9BACT|nr:ABC transporter ATP-binding protein [Desulfamplus magnetovallimortis]SLM28236.1 Energy-coupling factor transporter ATP-binding protein EcfA [Desulfamplus magnetovallimortis]